MFLRKLLLKNVQYLAVSTKLNLNTYKLEFEVALNAIKKASSIVMEVYHDDFTINIKNDNSEVTNADLASEKIIKEELTKHFEKLPGVGKKTALRYAYYVVEKMSLEEVKMFSEELIDTAANEAEKIVNKLEV